MTRYFMRDTPLYQMEQMMMTPPHFKPRGHGLRRPTFHYNWGELNVVSRTEYMLDEKCLAMPMGAMADMDIEPDDIDVSDTATFVWEIR